MLAASAGALLGSGEDSDPTAPAAAPPGPTVPSAPEGRRSSFLAELIPLAPREVGASGQLSSAVLESAARMPLEDRVAQLFLLGFAGDDPGAALDRVRRRDFGGLVIAGPSFTSGDRLAAVTDRALAASRRAKKVPPWVMAPQEGGIFSALPDLPPRKAPGELATPREAARAARAAGGALREAGITGVLAPVADVGLEAGGVLGTRAYSDDPHDVARYVVASVRAYRRTGVFAAVKHFPGIGSASQPTEEGPAQVGLSLAALRSRDLVPFQAAVEAGVPGIVVGHGLYPIDEFVTPASISSRMIGFLRDELGFRGVAITDDLADPPITALSDIPRAAVSAVNAGADMVYLTGTARDQRAAYADVLRAVRGGEIPRSRIDEALLRVLVAKERVGLIKAPRRRRAKPRARNRSRPTRRRSRPRGPRRSRPRASWRSGPWGFPRRSSPPAARRSRPRASRRSRPRARSEVRSPRADEPTTIDRATAPR